MRRGLWRLSICMALVGCGGDSRKIGPENRDGSAIGDGPLANVQKVPPGPPMVLGVAFPDGAAGLIPLRINVGDADSESVHVTIEVSLDGSNWKAARVDGAPLTLPSSPTGVVSTVTWNSIKDVGFHVPAAAHLRVTPSTENGGTGAAKVVDTPVLHNIHAAARLVNRYMVDYGRLKPESIEMAKRYELVIVHPTHGEITRDQIAAIQAGKDPNDPSDDVMVLGYVSVGEDLRTDNLSDAAIRADPRFTGDGSGPRVDPRGPKASGASLQGIDPRGAPSPGGSGYASFYLDDNSLVVDGRADGLPDRNRIFSCFFVNAGDPNWYPVIDNMTLASDALVGFREAMGTDHGRALGCDGVFLDTIDTAAPNFYTDGSSPNPGKFEWTAPGFASFIKHIHDSYPDKLVLQNRGVFFFDPRMPQYQFTTTGAIDFAFFESYRLNSNSFEDYSPGFYPDNRYNIAPKLMAEANRSSGFRVLSLGYAMGPSVSTETLTGQSTFGYDMLMEDIYVTQDLAGFRHYLSDRAVEFDNTFVLEHSSYDDHTAPVWSSTYNDNANPWPGTEPTPRIGIQSAIPGPGAGQITVRWDVAMDMFPVRYALYYRTTPFDFNADPGLKGATRVVLDGVAPAEYKQGVGPGVFANQAVVGGLVSGQVYYLLIRAFDASPSANEESNTIVTEATAS